MSDLAYVNMNVNIEVWDDRLFHASAIISVSPLRHKNTLTNIWCQCFWRILDAYSLLCYLCLCRQLLSIPTEPIFSLRDLVIRLNLKLLDSRDPLLNSSYIHYGNLSKENQWCIYGTIIYNVIFLFCFYSVPTRHFIIVYFMFYILHWMVPGEVLRDTKPLKNKYLQKYIGFKVRGLWHLSKVYDEKNVEKSF